MSEFSDKLARLCSREMVHARRDHERAAEMIERPIHSLALTIAVSADGDAKAISVLTEGATSHLFDTVSGMADVAAPRTGAP